MLLSVLIAQSHSQLRLTELTSVHMHGMQFFEDMVVHIHDPQDLR